MIYNVESIDRVIDKVIRDLGMGEQDIPFSDFIEWAADGLNHIGSYYQYLEKPCNIIIEDYEGRLPKDLHKVVRMIHACEITPGSGGFYGGTLAKALSDAEIDLRIFSTTDQLAIRTAGLSKVSDQTSSDFYGNFSGLNHNKNLIGPGTGFTNKDYNTNLNKITTSFKSGVIQLQYLSLPVDDRGWPLVPDNVSFRDALFWKIAYHVSMRNPKCLANPRMQDMEYCRQMWNKYCVQARAAANMPDLAMTERFANNWLRLFNTVDEGSNGYATIGKKQNLNFNGGY